MGPRNLLGGAAVLLMAGCVGDGAGPAAGAVGDGPRLAIDVAALNLAGVGDVVWDLEVDNGASAVVWQRRVSSSAYGDGAGSASYVGTCDAYPAASTNTVKVWVVGVFEDAVASAGTFANGAAGGVDGVAVPFQNPTTSGALTQTVTCAADTDVAVRFDVSLMRPAQQGFFDIAVSFNNIFCSAKFDCCGDANNDGVCQSSEDIQLLFDDGGARARTMVLGFACTAGPTEGVATTLYMDDLGFFCGSPLPATPDFTVSPAAAAAAGNQCTAGDMAGCAAVQQLNATVLADSYLYQVAVYGGEEPLESAGVVANKVYWNVALGVTGNIGDCTLRTSATADNVNDDLDGVVGGVVAAGAVYPYVDWDVPLGSCAAEPLSFDGTSSVQTGYTGTGDAAASFGYAFAASLPATPVCASPCLNGGSCTAPNTCACASGYEGATCAVNHDDCDPNPCLNGGTCSDGVDSYTCTCASGFTGASCETSSASPSCLALYQAGQHTDGPYSLDPGATGTSFTAYCDMTTADGGWTLVARVNGADAHNLLYYDWVNQTLGAVTDFDLTGTTDTLFQSYGTVAGDELLFVDATALCGSEHRLLQTPTGVIGGQPLRTFLTTLPNQQVAYSSAADPSLSANVFVPAFNNTGCNHPFHPIDGPNFPGDKFGINIIGSDDSDGSPRAPVRFTVQPPDWDTGIGSESTPDAWNAGDLDIDGDQSDPWSGHIVTIYVR